MVMSNEGELSVVPSSPSRTTTHFATPAVDTDSLVNENSTSQPVALIIVPSSFVLIPSGL